MGKDIWNKNITAMNKWYPAFAELIEKKKDCEKDIEVSTEVSWDGEKIFRVRKDEKMLYLSGKRNAKEPVQLWMENLGEIPKYASIFLFGIGSGAYLKTLIQNTEKEVNVVAYEPSITIFLTMLEEIDLSEEIENRPIAFVIEGINEKEFEPIRNQVLTLENLEFLKEWIHPNYKRLYADKIIKYVKLLDKRVSIILTGYNTNRQLSMSLAVNIISNMEYVCEGYHTRKLSEVIPYDGPAILVSAGPSLNKNIHELKKAKNKAFILAVDTAVRPLIKAGIVPDAFITLDALKPRFVVETPGAEKIPVIAPACARDKIIEYQKSKKIFYSDGIKFVDRIYIMNDKVLPRVASGGSVACSGFSLLYKMGFETIILTGQDLAFTGNKSHADGTFQEVMPEENTANMRMVKGNYEDKVPTQADFYVYLEWFNMYIAEIKKRGQVRVINATEGGAYIEGTEISTLRQAVEEVCHNEVDFSECISKMQSDLSKDEKKKAVDYLHTIPEKFEKAYQVAVSLEKVYKKLQKYGESGDMKQNAGLNILKRIKKLNRKLAENDVFELIEMSMPVADYVIRTEYFYEGDNAADTTKEIARKGILYSQLLQKCARMLKEHAEEKLLSLEV